jgi:hypothetical protein
MVKRAKIICKKSETGYGVQFVCSNCGKSIFVNSLTKRKQCLCCDAKFKNIIVIEREHDEITR